MYLLLNMWSHIHFLPNLSLEKKFKKYNSLSEPKIWEFQSPNSQAIPLNYTVLFKVDTLIFEWVLFQSIYDDLYCFWFLLLLPILLSELYEIQAMWLENIKEGCEHIDSMFRLIRWLW